MQGVLLDWILGRSKTLVEKWMKLDKCLCFNALYHTNLKVLL